VTIIFWVAVLFFVNYAGALLRIAVDPDWYLNKRFEAIGEVDVLGRTTRVKVVKIVQLAFLGTVIAVVGNKIGYW